jgi:para-aminobenzoate synthetase component 1
MCESASGNRPLVEELLPAPDSLEVFTRLKHLPHGVFFDSALRAATLGRYSFVTADPFAYWEATSLTLDPLGELAARVAGLRSRTVAGLPPFQGGAAGLLSYDLNRGLERIAPPRIDEFRLPLLAMGLYDVVIAFDHQQDRAWIVSQGWPETEPHRRRERAAARLAWFRERLRECPGPRDVPISSRVLSLPRSHLAPQFAPTDDPHLTSNFAAEDYVAMVRRTIDYIHAGDVFQVNVAQRLLYPALHDACELYVRLRTRNPAPFAGFFDLGPFQIVSASPERFVSVRGRQVETRPIKGTRQRCGTPEADLLAAGDLRENEKDRAENVMIVDLLRNDLSRVCTADSVRVSELCRLEVYQYVQHLVSVVEGELAPGRGPMDLLRAAFPGGSVTGAPKVRAMEIIQELEPTARGAYCGSLGYIGFDGALDMNILIRTITAGRGWWQLPVGSGIVAQSVPDREYEETWHKAHGMLRAIRP